MIKIRYKKFGILPITEYYFWYKEEKRWSFDSVFINQMTTEIKDDTYTKSDFTTGIIDITQGEEIIFKNFSDTTRNEIHRAEKEGITYTHIDHPNKEELKSYHRFYNQFLKAKGLKTIAFWTIKKYIWHLVLTYSTLENEILNYHLYLVDSTIGKARLLQSCSLFRKESDKNKINIIWYANRWLHYYDMKFFKWKGYQEYDWGWLYLWEEDKQKINIDKFKLSFGPETTTQQNYQKLAPIIHFIQKIMKWWRK